MNYIKELINRYPSLTSCEESLYKTVDAINTMQRNGNKILICGNGGSAADCEHISGELLKGFLLPRPYFNQEPPFNRLQQGIAALPLNSFSTLISAFSNDVDADYSYAQLTGVLGRRGDVFWGISTSGNAKNVCLAAKCAKTMGLITIGMTGADGGNLSELCDISIKAPENETYKIQELHLPIYHAVCAQCEQDNFA